MERIFFPARVFLLDRRRKDLISRFLHSVYSVVRIIGRGKGMDVREGKDSGVRRLERALPPFVRSVLQGLTAEGYEAFVVGGAVRDGFMGREITDWDVATSAGAQRIRHLFSNVRSFRLKHETVTLVFQGDLFEVTPFRCEGGGACTLEQDLAHRDFTLNAMAYDPVRRCVLDPQGGLQDMTARRIRAVGRAGDRFREDPLRMLRAVRLAASLGFRIEEKTLTAMTRMAGRIEGIPAERVRDELTKLLLAPYPSKGLRLFHRSGLMNQVLPELVEGHLKRQNAYHRFTILKHVMETVDRVEPTRLLRWTALLHDVAKPRVRRKVDARWRFTGHEEASAELARSILERLRMDRAFTAQVCHLIRHHLIGYRPEWTDGAVRRLIRRVGRFEIERLLAFRRADIEAHGQPDRQGRLLEELERRVRKALAAPLITRTRELALDGRGIMEITGLEPGPEVGRILERLMEQVTEDPSLNTKTRLKALVESGFEAGGLSGRTRAEENGNGRTSMDLEVRGTRVHVEASGPAHDVSFPSLLFLHGAGGDATLWEHQENRFREERAVLRLDLPGHGSSAGEGEKEMYTYGEWVRDTCREVVGEKPCVLVGHSMGGAIAMALAVERRLPLAGLVLVGTGAKLGVTPVVFRLLREDFEGFVRTIDGAALGPDAPAEARQRVTASLRRCSPETIHGDFAACDRFDIRDRLKEILVPTLVICGEEDRLTPLRSSEYLHREIAGAHLVTVPGAGHMVMLEAPDAVNEAMARFLSEEVGDLR